MAITLQAVPTAQIETVWKETFTSESINQRFRGIGRGIRHGFVPAIGGANDELDLDVDVRTTDSVAEVGGTGGQADITIQVREPAQVSLDLSALAADDYYVGIRPGYTTGLTTTASYVAYTLAEVQGGTPAAEGSTLLCRVTTTGNVGPLTDVRIADDEFIRDDFGLTGGRTQEGMLQQISAIDFGQGGGRIVSFSVGSLAQGTLAGGTGSGVLVVTPTAAAQQITFGPSSGPVFVRQGRSVVFTLRYQSNASIDGALSAISFLEFDEAGTNLGSTTSLLADTAGLWLEARRSFEPTSPRTRSVFVLVQMASSAASPFYLDYTALYVEKTNDEAGFDPAETNLDKTRIEILSPDPAITGFVFAREPGALGEVRFSPSGAGGNLLLNDNTGAVATITNAGGYPGSVRVLRSGDANFAEFSAFSGVNASTLTAAGAGDYFDFDDGTNIYRVWFNVDDGNTPPAVTTEVLIEVPVRGHWVSERVGLATAYAINGSAAAAEASSPQMRFFNASLLLQSAGLRLDADAGILFEDEFSRPNVVIENTLDNLGSVASGSIEARTADGKDYAALLAANLPLAQGLVRYNHGGLAFEYDTPDNTSGLNTTFLGTDATRAQFTIQLDTSIPIQSEGLHVQVSCSADISAGPTINSQVILPMWELNYISPTDVKINIVLVDPATGNPVGFGAAEDNIALSITVYGRREV